MYCHIIIGIDDDILLGMYILAQLIPVEESIEKNSISIPV